LVSHSLVAPVRVFLFFFFYDTATTALYTLSLHDALPISPRPEPGAARRVLRGTPAHAAGRGRSCRDPATPRARASPAAHVHLVRSEEHTSELQSRSDLVCRLLLEKKKKKTSTANRVLSTI